MYGLNVHKAVIEAKEKFSGLTIHYITENYDEGEYLLQHQVEVQPDDTPETLQQRILAQEHLKYSEVIVSLVGE